jgi:hypothetical protein
MIIDLILDRKNGTKYVANDFYQEIIDYGHSWPTICKPIIAAMDAGKEQDVIAELCRYVVEQEWNPQICNWIAAVKWLEDDPKHGIEIRVKYSAADGQGHEYMEQFTTWQPIPAQRDTDEQTLKPFNDTLRMALNMGWQCWRRLTMEVPKIHQTLVCEPRSAEAAQKLKELLERAEREGHPVTAETQARTIITKSVGGI